MPAHVAPSIEVFSDFDGTISMEDTGCIIIDTGFGTENRQAMDLQILHHELTFLEAMDVWWGSVKLTHTEGMDLLRSVPIDPGFVSFYNYAIKHNVPFSVVSCGLDFIIQEYLGWFLGDEAAAKVTILANYGKVTEDKKWLVKYRDDSPHSHDKSVCIKESKLAFLNKNDKIPGQDHIIVFCGDGISDLSAAREADILFARRGRNLEKYCRTHKIPFTAFDTFDQVTATIQGLTDGSLTMAEVNRRQQLECENEN
ncbi:hypothetical protein BGZ93_002070 [Podila epicladia]|nr:hypothetical protein BGZ92_011884 [Podila epicladia]KAG0083033.1 hypothetical protein BGZ93_002070 [Podila epicladia]